MQTYSAAIQGAVLDPSKGDVVVLAFTRAIDFAIVKTSALFLGFILAFLGALYVLRTGSVAFALEAHSGNSGGSLKTSSPGLVMISLGILTVAFALFDHTSVKIDSQTPLGQFSVATSASQEHAGQKGTGGSKSKAPKAKPTKSSGFRSKATNSASSFPPFPTKSAELTNAQQSYLRSLAGQLAVDPTLTISLSPEADDFSTTEENLALGERRIDAIKSFLASLTSPSSRITVTSYGKEPISLSHKPTNLKIKTEGK